MIYNIFLVTIPNRGKTFYHSLSIVKEVGFEQYIDRFF